MSTAISLTLTAFLRQNPGFDLHVFHRGAVDALSWDGVDRALVTAALGRAVRLRHAVPDPLTAHQLVEAGYSSLPAIARRATTGFIADLQGILTPHRARTIQRRARGAWAAYAQQWLRAREARSPQRRAYLGPRSVEATQTSENGVYYTTLFEVPPVNAIPDEMSVLGPGAYFVDLMELIDEEITRQNPSSLSLRTRRPDLWNLPLTLSTIHDEVSYADLTREILEATLLQFAPSISTLAGADTGKLPPNIHWCTDETSLAAALTGAANGDLIVVAGTIPLSSGLEISHNVALQAGSIGAGLVLDAGLTGDSALRVNGCVVSIENLLFTGLGQVPAIVVDGGTLTLVNTLFQSRAGLTAISCPGWAVRCVSGEVTIRNATLIDQSQAPSQSKSMLAATNDLEDDGATTFTVLSSILWTVEAPTGRVELLSVGSGAAVFNLAYCDLRGGDPREARIFYDNSNFAADPCFSEGFLKLKLESPCIGRGARGVNVGASVYDVYAVMAGAIYPFDVPFDTEVQSAVLALDSLGLSLTGILEAFAPFTPTRTSGPYTALSILGLGLGDFEVLSTPITEPSTLAPYYGLGSFDDENVLLTQEDAGTYTFRAADFAHWIGLTLEGLRELVYQDLSAAEIAAGVQRGSVAWASIPTKPWPGFFVNAGQRSALALRTVYAPVGRGYITFRQVACESGSPSASATLPVGTPSGGDGSFSLSLWLYLRRMWGALLEIGTSISLRWKLDVAGRLTLEYVTSSGSTTLLTASSPALLDRWVCLTTVYDAASKTLTLYLNDKMLESAGATVITPTFWYGGTIRLCPVDTSVSLHADAHVGVADVTLWAASRTAEQIVAGFQVPPLEAPGGTAPNLTCYWPLNDAWQTGSTVTAVTNWVAGGTQGELITTRVMAPRWGAAYLPENAGSIEDGKTCTLRDESFVALEVLTGEDQTVSISALVGDEKKPPRVGLRCGNLDRVNRFARLARRLSWSFADLDWALYTLYLLSPEDEAPGDDAELDSPAVPDFTTLSTFKQLADLSVLLDETGLELPQLCALVGYLKPYGRGPDGDTPPLFDLVYNQPPLAGIYCTPVMSHRIVLAGSTPGTNAQIAQRIAASLGFSTAELRRIAIFFDVIREQPLDNPPEATSLDEEVTLCLTWRTLSILYRVRVLRELFGLNVEMLIDLLSFTATAPAEDPLEDLLALIKTYRLAATAQVGPAQLRCLITNPATIDPPGDPYQEHLEQRFKNGVPALAAGFRRDLLPLRVTPQSFIRPGIDASASESCFEDLVESGYLTPTGLVASPLLALIPEVALRVPAEYPTLEAAVTVAIDRLQAEAASVVILVAPGDYQGEGNLDVEINLGGTAGELIILGEAGADATVFHGGSSSTPAFSVHSGAALTLEGLTIRGHTNSGNGTVKVVDVTQVTVRGCIFRHNSATQGGGLYVSSTGASKGNLQVENSVFYENTASRGGAIYVSNEQVSLYACTLSANNATEDATGKYGRAIYYYNSNVEIEHSILWNKPASTTDYTPADWAGSGTTKFTASYSDLYKGGKKATVSGTLTHCLYTDPLFADPENGDFTAQADFASITVDGLAPGYHPGLAMGPSWLFAAAFSQLEALRKTLVLFLDCGELPLVPILRYLGPASQNGIQVLGDSDTTLSDAVEYLRYVHLYLLLAFELELKDAELATLLADPTLFSLSPPPDSDTLWQPDRADLHTLARYFLLKKKYPDNVSDLLGYLRDVRRAEIEAAAPEEDGGDAAPESGDAPKTVVPVAEATRALAALFEWDPVNVATLLDALPADTPALSAILDISRAIDLSAASGLGIGLLRELNQNGFNFGSGGATPLIEAIAALDEDTAGELRGQIAEMKRRILQIFAMPLIDRRTRQYGLRVLDENQLSDYLLIDAGMSAATSTSRVLQGTLSLQQYVQRARLDLEPGITTLDLSDTRWGWMSSYRTWEANRRVFLYPENYLRPELRKDKTPLFVTLEDALAGVAITADQVHQQYLKYLEGLSTLASLHTVGAWYAENPRIDSAAAFTGRSSFTARSPSSQPRVTLTVETWVRIGEGLNFSQAQLTFLELALAGNSSRRAWRFCMTPDFKILFQLQISQSTAVTVQSAPLERQVWLHIAAVYSAAEAQLWLYVDGECVDTSNVTGGPSILSAGQPVLWYGLSDLYSANPQNQLKVTEIRIWDAVRAQAQIASTMRRRLTVDDAVYSQLRGYWTFEAGYWDQSQTWSRTSVENLQGTASLEQVRDPELVVDDRTAQYHLIARSSRQPYAYYHRIYQVSYAADDGRPTVACWKPLHPIDLAIHSGDASPVVFRGQLHLFWSEAQLIPDDDEPIAGGRYKVTLRYAVQKPDGSWSAPQSPFPELMLEPGIDPSGDGVWRKPYVVPTCYQGAPALLVQYGDYSGSSKPSFFVLTLDQTAVQGLTAADTLSSASSFRYSAFSAVHAPGSMSLLTGAPFWSANALPVRSRAVLAYSCSSGLVLAEFAPEAADPTIEKQSISLPSTISTNDLALTCYAGRYYLVAGTVGQLFASQAPGGTSTIPGGSGSWEQLTATMVMSPLPTSQSVPQIAGLDDQLYAIYRTSGGTVQLIRSQDGVDWEAVLAVQASGVAAPTLTVIGDDLYALYAISDTTTTTSLGYLRKSGGEWTSGTMLTTSARVMQLSPLVYWRDGWYCAAVMTVPFNMLAYIYLLHAPELGKDWTVCGKIDSDEIYLVGGKALRVGLLATDDALYCSYGQKEAGYGRFMIRSSRGRSPLDLPWQSTLQGYTSGPPILSGLVRTSAPIGTATGLLSRPGEHASVVPVANQLGSFVACTDGGDFLVEALIDDEPVNAQVSARVTDGEVLLSGRGATDFTNATFRFRRLSSAAVAALVQTLSVDGLDALLSPEAQSTPEYPFATLEPTPSRVTAPGDETISFQLEDAFGLYFRELFYFIPWLLAEKLRADFRYQEAQRWLEYIFRPTGLVKGDSYWQSVWLRDIEPQPDLENAESTSTAALALYHEDPFNAGALADLRPTAYQKAIFMAYVDNLIDWADDRFSLNTRETIHEAAQLYRYAASLLGPRPKSLPYTSPRPQTYADLSTRESDEFLIDVSLPPPVPALEYDPNGSLVAQGYYFGVPENPRFAGTWDRVDDRLFKIRHGLDLHGNENILPLFEPQLDPMDFVRAAAGGGQGSLLLAPAGTSSDQAQTLIYAARELARTVMDYGGALLRALEAQDAETLAALQARQQTALADRLREVRAEEVNEARATLKSLQEARSAAQHRQAHFELLVRRGLSRLELAELGLSLVSLKMRGDAAALHGLSVPLYLIPNVFGLANGGMEYGGAAAAAATTMDSIGSVFGEAASLAATQASYQRREEEWAFEAKLAGYDVDQLDAQLEAAARRVSACEMQYSLEETSLKQMQEVDQFYQSRFTSVELYRWMADSLGELYYQLYQVAAGVARQAQSACNRRMTSSTTYVSAGGWDSQHRGLLAGEQLYLDLARMEQDLLRWEELNPTATLMYATDMSATQPEALIALRTTGECVFDVEEEMLDRLHPGHYLRRIREVAIRFCGWEDASIDGELVQLSGSLVQRPEVETVRFLLHQVRTPGSALARGLRPLRAAFSAHGGIAEGMKAFAGAPLLGRWRLVLSPNARRLDPAALRDIRLTVRYESLDGGDAFRAAVRSALPPFVDRRLLDVAVANPAGWAALLEGAESCELRIERRLFARGLPGRALKVTRLRLFLTFAPLVEPCTVRAGCGPWLSERSQVIPTGGGTVALEQPISAGLEALCRHPVSLRLCADPEARSALQMIHLILEAVEE